MRPHGVRGALLVEGYSHLIESLRPEGQVFLGEARIPATVRDFRRHQKNFLLLIEGCHDRNAAERFRGQDIFVPFENARALGEGEYYHWQIIGLAVITEAGEALGVVEEILETGANDVYLVRGEGGETLLLPAIPEVILQVDLEAERLVVHLLPGLRPGE